MWFKQSKPAKNLLYKFLQNQEYMMAAIDIANTNLEQLKADVAALISKPAGVPEAQVQAIADAISALDVTVKAAL